MVEALDFTRAVAHGLPCFKKTLANSVPNLIVGTYFLNKGGNKDTSLQAPMNRRTHPFSLVLRALLNEYED